MHKLILSILLLSSVICSVQAKPEIEFKVLLIIKPISNSYHPLFLPIRSKMTKEGIKAAIRCFKIETADMVKDITKGKVKFTPKVYISKKPLRLWDEHRLDSAEFHKQEMLNEFYSITKPGDFDSVGYYFLHYDTESGYSIPRAGYGVGGYDGGKGVGIFAVHYNQGINPRDEIFLHEWLHGVEGFYGNKPSIKMPNGWLHGRGYDYTEAPWRPQDTFHGWMTWYRDFLNGDIKGRGEKLGLGSKAWAYGPMRKIAKQNARNHQKVELKIKKYPKWIYELMRGKLDNAILGQNLLQDDYSRKPISGTEWTLHTWNSNAETEIEMTARYGGSIRIESPKPNDTKLSRTITVDPFSNYIFSAEIMTKKVKIMEKGGQFSANLFAGHSQSSKDLSGSNSWTTVVLPFTTHPQDNEITIKLGLGGNSSTATGTVYFRNIEVRKVGYPLKQ